MLAGVAQLTAGLQAALGGAGEVIGSATGDSPRLMLFHAANSICSQKVRVVLAHHEMSYCSQTMNIFTGQTYLPDYVRLRLIGCKNSGVPLVSRHSGSTSMSSDGCDPAVVPTLVDRVTGAVLVDSKRICMYIDSLVPDARRLRPAALQKAVDAELQIVDGLPNYQMLAGKPIGEDLRPQRLRENNGVDFSMGKVKRCEQYMREFAHESALLEAYQAKRSKELDAAAQLFSDDAIRSAYAKVSAACAVLDGKLGAVRSAWLMGEAVTMADLFWAVELLRIKNLGAQHIWEQNRLPSVARFVAAVEGLPSVQSSVLRWPGALF